MIDQRDDDERDDEGTEPTGSEAPADEGRRADGEGSDGPDQGADEDIEILGVEAVDEAGVALPPDEPPPDGPGEEEAVDLSHFDAEVRGEGELRAELDAAGEQTEELRREKVQLESDVAQLRDRLQRTAADLENYRKRIARERSEERKQANSDLVKRLLPVADSFHRAIEQAGTSNGSEGTLAGFLDGLRLIENQFFDTLRQAGLEPVEAEGTFDPNVHEALMQESTTEAPHHAILEVFERGYFFGGRLLRPARVKVANNPAPEPEPEEREEDAPAADEQPQDEPAPSRADMDRESPAGPE